MLFIIRFSINYAGGASPSPAISIIHHSLFTFHYYLLLYLSPTPLSFKNLEAGFYFFVRLSAQCSHKPTFESFRPPFSKGGASQGRGALVAHRNGRNSPYPSQNAGEGEFLCLQRKRENPRRGFSLVEIEICLGFSLSFLKKVGSADSQTRPFRALCSHNPKG